jgi:lysophospholipase L1-like esterase
MKMNLLSLSLYLMVVYSNSALAKKIVVIGDSHSCGDFGKQLVKNLSDSSNNNVQMFCAGGLSVQHWVKGFTPPRAVNNCKTFSSENTQPIECLGTGQVPQLKKLIQQQQPDQIIVALGTNNIGLNGLPQISEFSDIIENKISDCIWVGPPALGQNGEICKKYGSNLNQLIEKIKVSTKNACRFIDSRPFTPSDKKSTPDCIHRYGKPAQAWADEVYQKIKDINFSESGSNKSQLNKKNGSAVK